LDLRNRGAKTAKFNFLTKTKMTAGLVEVCFVDNPIDRSKFRATPAGEAVAQAICEHLGKNFVSA
jgi:N-acetylmuramoyl-L-alanine amidase